jgi:hypothetical protein
VSSARSIAATVVNPDTVRAQVQSAIVFSITAALYGNITLKNGRVEQTHFDTYQMLRINEAPVIEVYIVQNFDPSGAMVECGTSAIVPAVANAIFAATGKRLRKMPVGRLVQSRQRPADIRPHDFEVKDYDLRIADLRCVAGRKPAPRSAVRGRDVAAHASTRP